MVFCTSVLVTQYLWCSSHIKEPWKKWRWWWQSWCGYTPVKPSLWCLLASQELAQRCRLWAPWPNIQGGWKSWKVEHEYLNALVLKYLHTWRWRKMFTRNNWINALFATTAIITSYHFNYHLETFLSWTSFVSVPSRMSTVPQITESTLGGNDYFLSILCIQYSV